MWVLTHYPKKKKKKKKKKKRGARNPVNKPNPSNNLGEQS